MRLILARHGQALSNIDPNYPGLDSPLTPLGEQQADRLGHWLKEREPEIDHILFSPLQRAARTAEIINQHLNRPMIANDDLREIERVAPLPSRRDPFKADTTYVPDSNDGYYDQYRAQVQRALGVIGADLNRPKPLLVVSHGGTASTLLRLIFERHDFRFWTYNTGLHVLAWSEGIWRVECLNGVLHLPADMLSS